MTIFLAANLIPFTKWGHLQLVYQGREIEVQAPVNPLSIPVGGKWSFFGAGREHWNVDNTPYFNVGDPNTYRMTALNFGDRTDSDVWKVLTNINNDFNQPNKGQGIDYNFYQNSNSYIDTLLYMVGASVTSGYRPNLATDGFPGVGTNVTLNGEAFGFNLNLSEGKDLINTGVDNDEVYGLGGNDTINTWAGDDTIDGGAGNDVLTGGAGRDTYIISAGDDTINDGGVGDTLSKFYGVGVETEEGSGIYELSDGATAELADASLIITHAEGVLTLQDWYKGDYGIMLDEGEGERETGGVKQTVVTSPIALDLGGNGSINLFGAPYGLGNNAFFDIDNDGFKEKVQWLRDGDGWLVMDRNGNGKIDNQREMFGDSDGVKAYTKLAALNTNNTGASANVINASDAAWGNLRVWIDGNMDGTSAPTELKTLDELGITQLSLETTPLRSTFVRNGSTYNAQDIFAGADQMDSWYIGTSAEVNDAALLIPASRGYGNVQSMHYAASANPTLLAKMQELQNMPVSGLDSYYAKLETAVQIWAGTDGASALGANTLVDWRHKATWDQFSGVTNDATNAPNGYAIEKSYSDFLGDMSVRFITQGALKVVFGNPTYDFANDKMQFSITFAQTLTNAQANAPIDMADKVVYWSEIARTVAEYEGYFKTYTVLTTETIKAQINATAGFDVSFKSLGGKTVEGTILGEAINDSALGNYISGFDGNDAISGNGGDDVIYGGIGNDTLRGGLGNDGLEGGSGDDNYRYVRGDGDDWLKDSSGADELRFENITRSEVSFVRTTAHPLANNFSSTSETAIKIVVNGGGSISITNQTFNSIESVRFSDGTIMTAQQLNDATPWIVTAGNNTISGGSGNNSIYGGDGNDVLYGREGNDYIEGEDGTDNISGNVGNDTIRGGNDNDTILGGDGNDFFNGEAGNDLLYGNDGDDRAIGGSGDDIIYGGLNNDLIYGDNGNDRLDGDSENDTIYGGAGNDTILGDFGNDLIYGDAGKDSLSGGGGNDVFVFSNIADNQLFTADLISDFNANGDLVNLRGLGFNGFDTDGGNTEAGELRIAGNFLKAIIISDQTGFTFEMTRSFTLPDFTNADVIWA